MKNSRLGKDITFLWKGLKINGEPIVSKENLTLEIHKSTGRCVCCVKLQYDVIDGNLVATWLGVNQKEIGEYDLTLWVNKGRVGQSAIDALGVVNLVKYTTLEGGEDTGNVETETIEIDGDNIAFAVIKGADATINGYNAVTISGRSVTQEGNNITIGDNVVVIEYGITPVADAFEAYYEGKNLILSYKNPSGGFYLSLVEYHSLVTAGTRLVFTGVYNNYIYIAQIDKNLGYLSSTSQIPTITQLNGKEDSANKEKVLSPTSTTKYPTSKAVADYVKEHGGGGTGDAYTKAESDERFANKETTEKALKDIRVLSVDENEKISKYASSLIEISELYTLVNITGRNNNRTEMLATILPSTDTDTGWLYEYLEGWRMCKVSNFVFTDNSTFASLCAYLDGNSAKLVTKTLTGDPANLTTENKTNLVESINEVDKEVGDLALKVAEIEPFVVEYGVTPYADIFNAFQAHRRCICYGFGANKATCELSSYLESLNRLYFSCVESNAFAIYAFHVNDKNVYTTITGSVEMVSRRVNTITSASTTTQYPSAKAVWDYVESKGGGGSLRPLFIAAGAVYNEETGYYELNGLTDITEEQMVDIYDAYGKGYSSIDQSFAFSDKPIRTNIPIFTKNAIGRFGNASLPSSHSIACMCLGCTNLEVFSFNVETTVQNLKYRNISFSTNAFAQCKKLREIIGIINMYSLSGANGTTMFEGCNSLVDVKLARIRFNVTISQSPLLSSASILYMVQNSEATSPAVITLHADAYARAQADADIQTALATKTNITLASA